ncbi:MULTISPECIES: orotate phosphoribosyltransferase [Bacillus]|uniref:Orotate phosphoribosyltransferase n=2 Tax=Bacillus TaxID=1386 RepID=A0A0M4FPK6_9BACI|nr:MULTISPECIES: orotate phosphoribosyltransferase [Bacillus]ALC80998.1 orotate phosphoribosyltransferase [Bacillus gobiensis]MBP1079951.1 orotate phosphoribosyltransferase [Bacillus capparidis]MED1095338.1 orotate phosphoribosyltransferase [Bacillus capparidis]
MKELIAKHLLNIEAVFLKPNDPFTWTSGMLSPIYCDNRITISYPEVRNDIAEGFKAIIEEKFPDVEMIAGAATGGVPHATLLSDRLGLPMSYVRSKPKGHGKGNQIEGKATDGQKVVIIEDLISTGGSVIKVANALKQAGCEVLGVLSIFTYGFDKAGIAFENEGISYTSLTDYDTLIKVGVEEGFVTENEIHKLKTWRNNPDSREWMKS